MAASVERLLQEIFAVARAEAGSDRERARAALSSHVDDFGWMKQLLMFDTGDPARVARIMDSMPVYRELCAADVPTRAIVLEELMDAGHRTVAMERRLEEGVGDMSDEELLEHLDRVKVAHKVMEIMEKVKASALDKTSEAVLTMQTMLSERRKALEDSQSRLRTTMGKFRELKARTMSDLDASKTVLDETTDNVHRNIDRVKEEFKTRDELHDEHILEIAKADYATRDMLHLQGIMLKNRKCGCLVCDMRSIRRWAYSLLGSILLFFIGYNISSII